MGKPKAMTIRVPADLQHRMAMVADREGVSINQLAMYIFAREISSFEAGYKISEYWRGYGKQEIRRGFDEVMDKVKSRDVPGWDAMP